jgi:hypothetical protein
VAQIIILLRLYKNTGYLIRMVLRVIYDMRSFLFVLLITITCFGHSLLIISNGNDEDNQFISGGFFGSIFYTYNMILGSYELEFGNVASFMGYIIFILCTILIMIVMLNLLIAIISETFAQVNQHAQNASY